MFFVFFLFIEVTHFLNTGGGKEGIQKRNPENMQEVMKREAEERERKKKEKEEAAAKKKAEEGKVYNENKK